MSPEALMYKFPSVLTTLAVSYLGFTLVIMITAAVFKNIVKTCIWCLTYTYCTPSESHDGILNQTYQFICYKNVPCSVGIYIEFWNNFGGELLAYARMVPVQNKTTMNVNRKCQLLNCFISILYVHYARVSMWASDTR